MVNAELSCEAVASSSSGCTARIWNQKDGAGRPASRLTDKSSSLTAQRSWPRWTPSCPTKGRLCRFPPALAPSRLTAPVRQHSMPLRRAWRGRHARHPVICSVPPAPSCGARIDGDERHAVGRARAQTEDARVKSCGISPGRLRRFRKEPEGSQELRTFDTLPNVDEMCKGHSMKV